LTIFDQNPLKKQLHTLLKLTKADMEKRFSKAKVGITPLQFGVLHLLQNEPLTMNEVARQFNFSPPTLVPVIETLGNEKLLERIPDQKDKRKIKLQISKKGTTLLKRIPIDDQKDALTVAFKKLTTLKQKQLLKLLTELTENFHA
jgi:MarR family transcriptional regulator, organic hydroperoxide resistance regulator